MKISLNIAFNCDLFILKKNKKNGTYFYEIRIIWDYFGLSILVFD
jgi:hypothetical protein